MKNNKYQITGIKGRLLHLGFVLLIVLLYACEGGYEPSVKDSDISFELIETEDNPDPNVTVLKVTVHIPSKLDDSYEVKWESVPEGQISTTSPPPETTIAETATFILTVNNDAKQIKITVWKWSSDEVGAPALEDTPVATATYKFTDTDETDTDETNTDET
jgi:hypothetical protein